MIKNMNILNSCIIRNPIYPIEKLDKNDIWNSNTILFNNKLLELVSLSSPLLYHQAIKLRQIEEVVNNKESIKILSSLRKYYTRICTRCTPFEELSTYTLANKCNENNKIVIEDNYKVLFSFGQNFISSVINILHNNIQFKNRCIFYSNPTIYKICKKNYFIEFKKDAKHILTHIKYDQVFNKIFKEARNGLQFQEIIHLIRDYGYSIEDSDLIINFLIDSSLVISEFTYMFKTKILIDSLYEKTCEDREIHENESIIKLFLFLYEHSRKILSSNSSYLANKEGQYFIIKNVTDLAIQNYFTTNVQRKIKGNKIPDSIFKDVEEAINLFFKIDTVIPKKNHPLAKFKNDFRIRYGENRKVPITEVLDPIIGIGYPVDNSLKIKSTLLDDLELPNLKELNMRDDSLSALSKLIISKMTNTSELLINDKEVNDITLFPNKNINLPPTFSVMAEVYKDQNQSNILFIKALGGRTAIQPLIRYIEDDVEVKELISQIINLEDNSLETECVFADIIFSLNIEIDNIFLRTDLRKHQIILNSNTMSSNNNKIFLPDIDILLENDKIKLWSRSLKKYVIPINSTVHNFDDSEFYFYKFLSDYLIELYDFTFLNINSLFSIYSYIPRVRYKNIIILSASWLITVKEIKWLELSKEKMSITEYMSKISEWRHGKNLPKRVLLQNTDMSLLINFELVSSIELFLSSLKSNLLNKDIWVSEFLYDTFETYVKDEENQSYANEFIFFINNTNENR